MLQNVEFVALMTQKWHEKAHEYFSGLTKICIINLPKRQNFLPFNFTNNLQGGTVCYIYKRMVIVI